MVDVSIRGGSGVRILAPAGAPIVTDAPPGVDVAVLDVPGGYLTWSVLAAHIVPAAVLDDLDAAQDWVWALYGADVALALSDDATIDAQAARPELATAVYRLGYAQWAARWWPASILDAIAPLPMDLLAAESAELATACDDLVEFQPAPAGVLGRADDYALAASGAVQVQAPVVLARGTTENDWRTYPPRVLDAAENAATWIVERRGGVNVLRVDAVAAPDLDPALPRYLWPHAVVGDSSFELALAGDRWFGETEIEAPGRPVVVEVPGFGGGSSGRAEREHVRAFVRRRLALAGTEEWLLRAETAAALADPDY